jgi:hypothetical protein
MKHPMYLMLRLAPLMALTALQPSLAHGDAHKHTGPQKHHALEASVAPFVTPPPRLIVPKPHAATEGLAGFSKHLYSAVGSKNATDLVRDFREDFKTLEHDYADLKPTLGDAMGALFDMRLQDLQASVGHTQKMRAVLDLLRKAN